MTKREQELLMNDPFFVLCIKDMTEYMLRGPGRRTVSNRMFANAIALENMFRNAKEKAKSEGAV